MPYIPKICIEMAEGGADSDIISGVMSSIRETFESEGVDPQVLEKLEQLWISKLKRENAASKGQSSGKFSIEEEDDSIEMSIEMSGDAGQAVDSPQAVGKGKNKLRRKKKPLPQVDGPADTSDEDDDGDDAKEEDDDDDDSEGSLSDELDPDGEKLDDGIEEEPLCSEDDNSDEEATDLFDTENVVVCQYDKITRAKNKWKFHLKDGIMNLNGKDYVFQRAHGEAEW